MSLVVKKFYMIGTILFLAISLLLGGLTVGQMFSMHQQKKHLNAIGSTLSAQPPPTSAPQDVRSSLEERFSGYAEIAKQNSDFKGWISIPETSVDYPVMHTPDQPNYYLRRDFDRQSSTYGVPYLAESCEPQKPGHILIYGHNIMTGGLFSPIKEYTDASFRTAHSKIVFDTLTVRREYEVLYAFETDASVDSFPYETFIGIQSEDKFEWFIENCEMLSDFDPITQPKFGDELLILSTCSYKKEQGRFVVVARLTSQTNYDKM